jgi:hypothetical protein
MFETVLGITATLAWALLVSIVVVIGCAAFVEFAPASNLVQRIEAMGRFVGAKFHS